MTRPVPIPSRRTAIKAGLAAGAGLAIGSRLELFAEEVARQQELPLFTTVIPRTGERIPPVGLGTNRYSVSAPADIENLCNVLKTLTDRGGSVVDTARGYGRAEEVIGGCITENGNRDQLFLVTKYTESNGRRQSGGAPVDHMAQMELVFERLQTDMIDVMLVHEVRDAANLLPMMRELKAAGRFRYVGVSTSSDRDYRAMAPHLGRGELDFLQVDYSIGNRSAEETMLPLALEQGTAVVCNLPFGGRRNSVLSEMGDAPLPGYAAELDCTSWAQLYLKYLVSHPAVTAVIPGTTKVEHAIDNNGATRGRMPDAAMRARIEATYDQIAGA
ncbi:MAG: aldo/keto reductase [Gemmatimonadetes bacterium]|nr:aldo/keto reductase [Gemmatimonadota bacterium]